MAALVLAVAAPQLVEVERLAETTRAEVIPEMVVQHKRAVWTESLRSAADLVVHAPDPAVRKDALMKAEQLVTALSRGRDDARSAALARALAGIRLAAAGRTIEATRDGNRQSALAANVEALEAGHEAKRELARLRETLTADAALAAEASIADIADRVRAIRNVALAALGAGVAAAVGITLYGQQTKPDLESGFGEDALRKSPEGWQRDHLARAGELARRHHQAQRNLDHWRDALPTKLQSTIVAILMGSPPEQEEGEAEAPFAAVSEAHPPAPEDARSLPDPVPELIDGIRDQLIPLTARAADLGMATVADCIVAASEPCHPRAEAHAASQAGQGDPDLSVLRLETVTATVEQVVIQIGLCLGDINALTGTAEPIAAPKAPSNVELVAQRLQGLFEELVIAREHLDASSRAPC